MWRYLFFLACDQLGVEKGEVSNGVLSFYPAIIAPPSPPETKMKGTTGIKRAQKSRISKENADMP